MWWSDEGVVRDSLRGEGRIPVRVFSLMKHVREGTNGVVLFERKGRAELHLILLLEVYQFLLGLGIV